MSVTKLTDETFLSDLESNQFVLVKYFANWCGSCKLFSPKFKRLSDDDRFSSLHFAEVNAEENEMARRMAGVSNLPFFALFKNGNLVEAVSTTKEEVLLELMSKAN
jgi:thiol-disulfide isomerase/thioredoxin